MDALERYMKKIVTAVLSAAVMLSLTGCARKDISVGIIGGADGPTEVIISDNGKGETDGISLWLDWSSLAEAENAAGFVFGVPETIEGSYVAESYRTMPGETPVIEVTYADEDWTVVVRKAPGEGQDLSGIYDYDIQTGGVAAW